MPIGAFRPVYRIWLPSGLFKGTRKDLWVCFCLRNASPKPSDGQNLNGASGLLNQQSCRMPPIGSRQGKDGWTMGWSTAVISLRSEDVIVTHSSPAARDGRTFAVVSWTIIRPNPCHHAVGIRCICVNL